MADTVRAAVYAVVTEGPQWRIAHNGQLFDYFATEAAAIATATATAQTAVAAGFDARVMVETSGGSFREAWRGAAQATPHSPAAAPPAQG